MKVDAIINPTDSFHSNSGSIDYFLKNQYTNLPQTLDLSKAYLTKSRNSNFKYIIHPVGPVWIDGQHNEAHDLESCYKNCLNLALQNEIYTLAFPLIASGTFQFPKELSLQIAKNTIEHFLQKQELDIY